MYEKFLKMSCDAENELNSSYFMDNIVTMNKQYARLRSPMNFDKNNTSCENVAQEKRKPVFCKRNPICDELIQKARNGNGNNQKMFLLNTKNREYRPENTFYWVDY
jgi:hypothetical protein